MNKIWCFLVNIFVEYINFEIRVDICILLLLELWRESAKISWSRILTVTSQTNKSVMNNGTLLLLILTIYPHIATLLFIFHFMLIVLLLETCLAKSLRSIKIYSQLCQVYIKCFLILHYKRLRVNFWIKKLIRT